MAPTVDRYLRYARRRDRRAERAPKFGYPRSAVGGSNLDACPDCDHEAGLDGDLCGNYSGWVTDRCKCQNWKYELTAELVTTDGSF